MSPALPRRSQRDRTSVAHAQVIQALATTSDGPGVDPRILCHGHWDASSPQEVVRTITDWCARQPCSSAPLVDASDDSLPPQLLSELEEVYPSPSFGLSLSPSPGAGQPFLPSLSLSVDVRRPSHPRVMGHPREMAQTSRGVTAGAKMRGRGAPGVKRTAQGSGGFRRAEGTRCLGPTYKEKAPAAPTAAPAVQRPGPIRAHATRHATAQRATRPPTRVTRGRTGDCPGPRKENNAGRPPHHQPRPRRTEYWAPRTHGRGKTRTGPTAE